MNSITCTLCRPEHVVSDSPPSGSVFNVSEVRSESLGSPNRVVQLKSRVFRVKSESSQESWRSKIEVFKSEAPGHSSTRSRSLINTDKTKIMKHDTRDIRTKGNIDLVNESAINHKTTYSVYLFSSKVHNKFEFHILLIWHLM